MFSHLNDEERQSLLVQMLREIKLAGGQLRVVTYRNRKGRTSKATFVLIRPTRWGSMRVMGEYGKYTVDPLEALFEMWQDRYQTAPTAMEELEAGYVLNGVSRNGW